VVVVALDPPDALWRGDGEERLDALDRVWLRAEAHGGVVARAAAHAVRASFPSADAALAWLAEAWAAAAGWDGAGCAGGWPPAPRRCGTIP